MKNRLGKLALIFGAGREVFEDLDRIEELPIEKRADACRDLLALKKYGKDTRASYEIIDRFFHYLDHMEIYAPEKGTDAETEI